MNCCTATENNVESPKTFIAFSVSERGITRSLSVQERVDPKTDGSRTPPSLRSSPSPVYYNRSVFGDKKNVYLSCLTSKVNSPRFSYV